MQRPLFTLALAALVALSAATFAGADTVAGTWRKLAPEPVALPYGGGSVWTGSRLIVFGRRPLTKTTFNPSVNAAVAYDPSVNRWTTLTPPAEPGDALGCCRAVWTGKEMLVLGAQLAYDPTTQAWRKLRKPIPEGLLAWTGREVIGWGGGCCGDVQSNGVAYDPATDRFRALPRSPLAPSQTPIGAWDGRELLLFVSGYDAEGKPYPDRYVRAAAYNPAKNTWRRIAPLPVGGARFAGRAVLAGRRVIVVGAGQDAQATFAYDPATNRWRRLAAFPSGRAGATAVWTGTHVLVWGGASPDPARALHAGLSYDPQTNRWSSLPQPPLRAPSTASIAWTGRSLLAFGGVIGSSVATHNQQIWLRGAAAFTPSTP